MASRWTHLLLLVFGATLLAALGAVAARTLTLQTDPLAVLPISEPEIRARQFYQEAFLPQNDLILTLRSPSGAPVEPAVARLVAALEARWPELAPGITWQGPWEAPGRYRGLGELLGYLQANRPAADQQTAARNLADPAWLADRLEDTQVRIATSFSPGSFEMTRLTLDPLGLSEVPGLELEAFEDLLDAALGSGDMRAILLDLPPPASDTAALTAWQGEIEAFLDAWEESERIAGTVPIELERIGSASYRTELAEALSRELTGSALWTLGAVLAIFLAVYRTIYPLLPLAVTVLLSALLVLASCGLLGFELNAISIGCAAILISLVVDYAVIVYQDRADPTQPGKSFRNAAAAPVLWAALTTATVFSVLHFSHLPGIAQLGRLVTAGLAAGALLSLTFFRFCLSPGPARAPRPLPPLGLPPRTAGSGALALFILVSAGLAWKGPPGVDSSPDALLPDHLPSVERYEAVQDDLRLGANQPVAVLFMGEDPSGAMLRWRDRLAAALPATRSFTPSALWPVSPPPDEAGTRTLAAAIPEALRVLQSDFGNEAHEVLAGAAEYWERCLGQPPGAPLPAVQTELAKWGLDRTLRVEAATAKGFVLPPRDDAEMTAWRARLLELAAADPAVVVLGWDNLGPLLSRLGRDDLFTVVLPATALILVALGLLFRSFRGVFLAVCSLALTTVFLLGAMRLLGISWNAVNFTAIPLLLGVTLDYNIHTQLALQRTGGDARRVGRTLGKALLVCGLSTAAGFASLGQSSHAGLASLGQICALGILAALITALTFLPGWWSLAHPRAAEPPATGLS